MKKNKKINMLMYHKFICRHIGVVWFSAVIFSGLFGMNAEYVNAQESGIQEEEMAGIIEDETESEQVVVVIDPGHGGENLGGEYEDYTEKEMTMVVANAMKEELEKGMLAMLGINDFLNVRVAKMSGGMKKRLSIGCAISYNPQILIMDEPSAALDLICKERIHTYIRDFKSRGGIVILATHEEQEINL